MFGKIIRKYCDSGRVTKLKEKDMYSMTPLESDEILSFADKQSETSLKSHFDALFQLILEGSHFVRRKNRMMFRPRKGRTIDRERHV